MHEKAAKRATTPYVPAAELADKPIFRLRPRSETRKEEINHSADLAAKLEGYGSAICVHRADEEAAPESTM